MSRLQESPEYVQTSLAGALCLGLEKGKFLRGAKTTCLNLLLTYKEGCAASCAYCGLNQKIEKDTARTFIRVKWPVYSMDLIMDQLQKRRHPFKRMCMSMITHKRAVEDSCIIIRRFKEGTGLPVSGLISPTVMDGKEDLSRLQEAGTDHIGIAVDAATPELFDKYRGQKGRGPHHWEKYWQMVADAVDIYGAGKVGIHLITGIGENEKEIIHLIAVAQNMGVTTHLFSFFPEKGSLMENHPQPPMGQYRRVQLARYLINNGIIQESDIHFSQEGRVLDYGIDIEPYITSGMPFITSGCPGEDGMVACNRPFANERVNQYIRNFPFIPEPQDIEDIRSQIWDGV